MSTNHVRPIKPLVIQPVTGSSAGSVAAVEESVNIQAPVEVFTIMVMVVLLICLLCGLLPWLTTQVGKIRAKNQTDSPNSRVVLND